MKMKMIENDSIDSEDSSEDKNIKQKYFVSWIEMISITSSNQLICIRRRKIYVRVLEFSVFYGWPTRKNKRK